jgi:hypothetical protein
MNKMGNSMPLAGRPVKWSSDQTIQIRVGIMRRCLLLASGLIVSLHGPQLRGDTFDRYTNPVLLKAPATDGVREVKQLTVSILADNEGVIPGIPGALVVVRTNEGRFSKLLVQPGR